ncbi:DUF483 domain-containing protein [Candidatus Woesearchaeota archaeon]|nr:DUF483 domain-containing protein [Candidatus Woesearchaeota archaeon]
MVNMSDLYQTKEWGSLPAMERAYLLPTIEGIREGCIVSTKQVPNIHSLEYCLNQKGLKYHKKESIVIASANEEFLEKIIKELESMNIAHSFKGLDKKADKIIKEIEIGYHKNMGEFLGYPKCCTNGFIKSTLKRKYASNEWFKKAAKACIKGKYDPLFDYIFHVPHSIDCKKSLRLCKDIKECLECYDKKAAENLRIFNRGHLEKKVRKCTTT